MTVMMYLNITAYKVIRDLAREQHQELFLLNGFTLTVCKETDQGQTTP